MEKTDPLDFDADSSIAEDIVLENANNIAARLNIKTVFIISDNRKDIKRINQYSQWKNIFFVHCGVEDLTHDSQPVNVDGKIYIELPRINHNDALKLAVFQGVLHQHINPCEPLISVYSDGYQELIDTLTVTSSRFIWPFLQKIPKHHLHSLSKMNILPQAINILLKFSEEGREGKNIGATFVIGCKKDIYPYTEQLIYNPCKGHSKTIRNIYNRDYLETLREFSAMDGAFLVNRGGTIMAAGSYLSAPADDVNISSGYGARHTAAAAITQHCNCISVVLSESSGEITIFQNGSAIIKLGGRYT